MQSILPSKSIPLPSHLETFFGRVCPGRGRLIFTVDATASRQPSWDQAARLTAGMFDTVAVIGGLDVQLVYFRGLTECAATRWFTDSASLKEAMSCVTCKSGPTQIGRVLRHARNENQRQQVNALVLVGDAFEESVDEVCVEACGLGVPCFLFQEGDDPTVGWVYNKIAKITNGATDRFDAGAAQRLGDLLRAVAAFAAGGLKALAAQKIDAATLLLTQIKK
jgi:hypothetical protein